MTGGRGGGGTREAYKLGLCLGLWLVVRDSVCSGFSQYLFFIYTHIQLWAVSVQGTLYIQRVTLTEH